MANIIWGAVIDGLTFVNSDDKSILGRVPLLYQPELGIRKSVLISYPKFKKHRHAGMTKVSYPEFRLTI